MKTFGQVITEARKKASLKQKEVAERLRRAGFRGLPLSSDTWASRRSTKFMVVAGSNVKTYRTSN